MDNPLYRPEAMDRFSSPDQLDKLLEVTGPRDWLWLSALLLLAASLLGWALLGRVPVEVVGEGVLDHNRGVAGVVAPVAGLVQQVLVEPGQPVTANQPAVTLDHGQTLKIPQDAVVSKVWAHPQMYVEAGAVLVGLGEPDRPYYADVFVSPAEVQSLRPGMTARCAPYTVRPEVYGFVLGQVEEVSPVLSTAAEMEYLLRDVEMARRLQREDLVHHVVVKFARTADTPSGLEWSDGQGPPWKLGDFGRCTVTLLVGERRPLDLLVPWLP